MVLLLVTLPSASGVVARELMAVITFILSAVAHRSSALSLAAAAPIAAGEIALAWPVAVEAGKCESGAKADNVLRLSFCHMKHQCRKHSQYL